MAKRYSRGQVYSARGTKAPGHYSKGRSKPSRSVADAAGYGSKSPGGYRPTRGGRR